MRIVLLSGGSGKRLTDGVHKGAVGWNRTVTKKKTIQAGRSIEETKHRHHLEVWTVLSGRAVVSIRGRKHDALAGKR